jgi:hypothetical protein
VWRKTDYTMGFVVVRAAQLILGCGAVSVGRSVGQQFTKFRKLAMPSFSVSSNPRLLGLLGGEDEDVSGTTRKATQYRIPEDP